MQNLFNKVTEFFFETVGNRLGNLLAFTAIMLPMLFLGALTWVLLQPEHPSSATVMITNLAGNRGGSGVVIRTSPEESLILTNNHVCEGAVAKGGKIRKVNGEEHIATSFVAADDHDLCIVTVAADLHIASKVAPNAPNLYERATVTGHPGLLPNVVNTGHFGGRQIIQVMTGIRPCSKEEQESPAALMCMILGGIPIIKTYESMLVTASIMGGSSGSAVLNDKGEISGLVFAGRGDGLSYAFVVPHEAILKFLKEEADFKLKFQRRKPGTAFSSDSDESKKLRQAQVECGNPTSPIFDTKECEFIRKDYGSDQWKL